MCRAKVSLILFCFFVFSPLCSAQQPDNINNHPATDVYDGWRLGIQAWTFNSFTFYETVEKTAALGLDWIEAYPGQRLSKEKPEEKFIHTMSPEIREEVKKFLSDSGVRVINYGVVDLPNDEKQCREVFDFAKDMSIETIVSEPPEDAFDMIDKLCQEYKIKVAIHNHPKPSHYWNPDTVADAVKGYSKWIGACADTGHWIRSGINPVEALKKLQGRIVSLHIKDLNEFGNPNAHDVIWGTGKADFEAILNELDRQKFKGVISIEYEYNWENSMPDLQQCIKYYNKTAEKFKPTGWHDLFSEDLSNCIYNPGSWTCENGIFAASKDDFLWSKEKYGNFILDLEFKLAKGSNSGVFLRCSDIQDWLNSSIEVQVLDSFGVENPTKHDCGAIYDCLEPSGNPVKEPGKWNHYTITCKNNKIVILLNGKEIINMNLDKWTQANENPDGTKNKFNRAYKDLARVGHVGLQGLHGDIPVWYRNIKIKTLKD